MRQEAFVSNESSGVTMLTNDDELYIERGIESIFTIGYQTPVSMKV